MLRSLHLPRRRSSSLQNSVGGTLKQATGRVLHDRSLEWEGILQRQKELGTPRADRAMVEAGMAADLSVMRREPVAGYPTDAPGIRSSNNEENYRQNSGRARHEERGRKDDEEETTTKQGQNVDEEKMEEAKEKRKRLEEDRMKAEYKKEWQERQNNNN
ncbi:hypothetical protein QOT17_011264 [Balamuthia mandrillaris]